MSKYNSKKTVVDGVIFDSKSEANYYKLLKQKQEKRLITDLKLQPVFVLQNSYKLNGKTVKAITYKADFSYLDLTDNKRYVIDVKGMPTEVANIKRKMFNFLYSDEYNLLWIVENKKWGQDGWIEYDKLKAIRKQNRK